MSHEGRELLYFCLKSDSMGHFPTLPGSEDNLIQVGLIAKSICMELCCNSVKLCISNDARNRVQIKFPFPAAFWIQHWDDIEWTGKCHWCSITWTIKRVIYHRRNSYSLRIMQSIPLFADVVKVANHSTEMKKLPYLIRPLVYQAWGTSNTWCFRGRQTAHKKPRLLGNATHGKENFFTLSLGLMHWSLKSETHYLSLHSCKRY